MIRNDCDLDFLAYFVHWEQQQSSLSLLTYLILRVYINSYGNLQFSHFIYADKNAAEESKYVFKYTENCYFFY
jgi:hypothetical protein